MQALQPRRRFCWVASLSWPHARVELPMPEVDLLHNVVDLYHARVDLGHARVLLHGRVCNVWTRSRLLMPGRSRQQIAGPFGHIHAPHDQVHDLLGEPWLFSASFRISDATTANPLPYMPARAASMAAFSASRSVFRGYLFDKIYFSAVSAASLRRSPHRLAPSVA